MSKLNEKQKLFCLEYLKDLNGTQAAIRAGYAKGSADVHAVRLLADDRIKAFVQERIAKRSERLEMTADRTLLEIRRLAFVDTSKAYGPDGKVLPIHEIPEDVRRAIKSIDTYEDYTEGVEVGETQKITWWDKNKSLEMLGRNQKLFTDKIESHNSHALEYARDVSGKPTEELVALAKALTAKLDGKK